MAPNACFSTEEFIIHLWNGLLAEGHQRDSVEAINLVTFKMNYNDDGTRIMDEDGEFAPWIDYEYVSNVIRAHRRL